MISHQQGTGCVRYCSTRSASTSTKYWSRLELIKTWDHWPIVLKLVDVMQVFLWKLSWCCVLMIWYDLYQCHCSVKFDPKLKHSKKNNVRLRDVLTARVPPGPQWWDWKTRDFNFQGRNVQLVRGDPEVVLMISSPETPVFSNGILEKKAHHIGKFHIKQHKKVSHKNPWKKMYTVFLS